MFAHWRVPGRTAGFPHNGTGRVQTSKGRLECCLSALRTDLKFQAWESFQMVGVVDCNLKEATETRSGFLFSRNRGYIVHGLNMY